MKEENCNAFSHTLCTEPLCWEDWQRLVKEVEGPRRFSPEKAAFLEECRIIHEYYSSGNRKHRRKAHKIFKRMEQEG